MYTAPTGWIRLTDIFIQLTNHRRKAARFSPPEFDGWQFWSDNSSFESELLCDCTRDRNSSFDVRTSEFLSPIFCSSVEYSDQSEIIPRDASERGIFQLGKCSNKRIANMERWKYRRNRRQRMEHNFHEQFPLMRTLLQRLRAFIKPNEYCLAPAFLGFSLPRFSNPSSIATTLCSFARCWSSSGSKNRLRPIRWLGRSHSHLHRPFRNACLS